ncbi:MAG: secretin N-terminal domain-containing protein [Microcystaceae cyanobacterium]
MNLFRFSFVNAIAACVLIAVQPALAVAPEPGITSSSPVNLAEDSGEELIAQFPGQGTDVLTIPAPSAPGVAMPSSPNGVLVPNPGITIKSNGMGNPDIIKPPVPALSTFPRAIAPPVGDISVSNINPNYDPIDLGPSGRTIVPRLVLREAPVKEVLMVLARYAGVNIIFTGGDAAGTPPAAGAEATGQSTISLDLQNEPVQQVFNSVLMVSGMKANKQGSTIFVGKKLPDAVKNVVSRTLRLNQAKAENVATILASQGAEFNLLTQPETILDPGKTTIEGGTISIAAPTAAAKPAPSLTSLKVAADKESGASYLLKDLLVSIDDRLNSLTLIGEPRQVELATSIVLQMDARRRQVAINVKVVDVSLSDTHDQQIDFVFGDGNNYRYGQIAGDTLVNFGNSVAGGLGLPLGLPYPTSLSARINYKIATGNAKVLTDPTLVVQEGQVANVAIVQKILAGSETTYQTTGTGTSAGTVSVTTPVFEYVGLTLGINVESIDDNGFISFVVRPTISAPSGEVTFDSGLGGANTFTLIAKREVQSGLVRLRDGQTLILSGIITEQDRSTVSKVPILGDIPVLGALFRSQSDVTQRSEVIVMLTPKIIQDDQNAQFGYNYTPNKATADYLKQQSFPVQPQP